MKCVVNSLLIRSQIGYSTSLTLSTQAAQLVKSRISSPKILGSSSSLSGYVLHSKDCSLQLFSEVASYLYRQIIRTGYGTRNMGRTIAQLYIKMMKQCKTLPKLVTTVLACLVTDNLGFVIV